MAGRFVHALGYETGKSLVEEDKVTLAGKLLDAGKGKILLPFDHVVASAFKADAETKTLPVNETPEGWMGLFIPRMAWTRGQTGHRSLPRRPADAGSREVRARIPPRGNRTWRSSSAG